MLAFPPDDAQLPAVAWKRVCSCAPLVVGSELSAKSVIVPGTDVGRASAQMMAPGSFPFDETTVKKPGSCPLGSPIEPACWSLIGRAVGTFNTVTVLPPLATMRGAESLAASKYDWPHQQPPMFTVSKTWSGPL